MRRLMRTFPTKTYYNQNRQNKNVQNKKRQLRLQTHNGLPSYR